VTVKRYEGLFILNTAEIEEGINQAIDKIRTEIAGLGGKVDTVQKMDRRSFARVANKKQTAGFYVNFIFDAPPDVAEKLKKHFALHDEVFRVLVSIAPEPKPAAAK
jgi:small subunit ribosomal protein S6